MSSFDDFMYRNGEVVVVVIGILLCIFALVFLLGVSVYGGEPEQIRGTVVDMSHIPSTLRTNVSPVVVPSSSGASVGVAVTSSGSGEENFLIVHFPLGYEKVDARNIANMYNYEIGEVYTFCKYTTIILGIERLKTCD